MSDPGATPAKPLSGQSVFITGAAKRIGRAVAFTLAEAGADVALTFLGSRTEAEETAAAIAGLGVRSRALPCDVRSESSVRDAIAASLAYFGRLDILVNNAGTFTSAPLEDITVSEWDEMLASNTRGPFLVAKAAYPALKAAHGRIINMGSLGGLQPWATHAHYCTSKAALHMLSRTMARAWAPEISVNCIAPGMIVQPGDPVDDTYRRFAGRTPMQRNGTNADVAAAALFFATAPHFITGQLLAVDGGLGL